MRTDFLAKGTALPNFDGASPIEKDVVAADQGSPGKVPAAIKPRTKSLLISGGLYIGGGLLGGGVKLALRHFIPSYSSGATPLVNVGTQIAMSPGQQALQLITSPLSVWGYRFVKGKEEQGGPAGIHGIDPAIERELAGIYGRRSSLDAWVTAPVAIFNDYQRMLSEVCDPVRLRLDAGDVTGAARLLGAALFFDKQIWGQLSPASAQAYQLLYISLNSFFLGCDPAALAEMRKQAVAEALRLDGGKDKDLGKYVEAIVTGITTGAPPPALVQPWGNAKAVEKNIVERSFEVGGEEWARKLIEHQLNEELAKCSPSEQGKLKKQFTKAIASVQKDLVAFEQANHRNATLDELWTMTQQAFEKNAGKSIETRMALITVGFFALIAGAASFGNVHLLKVLPAWAQSGVGAVAPTLISYLSVLGRFGVDKFVAFGRALGFRGTTRATLGQGLDREFRNMKVRTSLIDRRAYGIMGYFTPQIERLQMMSAQAGGFVRKGKVDQAVSVLAGALIAANTVSYYFWPFSKLMHRLFDRVGPYFDGITAAQREELAKKVLERVKASGVDDDTIATYHKPFITGLLGRNVKVAA